MNRKDLVRQAVALALAANAPQVVVAQSASVGLEEVIVTATRRETSLQDAPIAVQVLDSSALESLNIGSFADYLQYSPNMQGQGAQPGTQFIEMRGVGAYGGNLAQAGTIGAKASVATYLDDTPLSAGASGTRNTDLYVTDIDRIEVLAGPQGTLFGSASMSGAIRMISNKPRADGFDARVEVTGGQTQGSGDLNHTVEGMLNVPIVADRLAVRLAAYNVYQAGYLDNTPASESLRTNTRVLANPTRFANTAFGVKNNFDFQPQDMNDVKYQGGRLSVAWQISDDWKAGIQYTQQKLETRGPFFYRDDIGDLKVARYENEFLNDDTEMAAWTLEGRLAALDVVYAGSFVEREIAQTSDYSQYTQSGPFFPYYACNFPTYTTCQPPDTDWSVFGDYRIQHHELRFSSDPTRRLNFIAGAYYHKNGCAPPSCGTSIEFAYYGAIANGFAPNAPVAGSISYNPNARTPGTMFFTDMTPIVEELSFFGDVTFKISDRWSISAGARKYKIDQSATGSVNFGSRTNPNAGVNFSTNLVPVEESDTIKRLNVTFDISENTKLYATISEGFSTGGYNRNGGTLGFDGVTRVPLSYDTETTENAEFGWKTTFADRRGRINGAIYRIDWDGIVVGVLDQTITNALFFINAGKAQVTGLEADLTYLLNDQWLFSGAVAVTDSELTELAPGARNIVPVGSQLARQPVLGGNARLRYSFNVFGAEAYAMFGAVYQGSRYNGVNPGRTKSPDYTIYDLNVGANFRENWSAQLSIKNLMNERYEISRAEVPNVGFINKTIGRPRTIGLTVTYKVK